MLIQCNVRVNNWKKTKKLREDEHNMSKTKTVSNEKFEALKEIELKQHQIEYSEKVKEMLENGQKRVGLNLYTSAGKTFVAGWIIQYIQKNFGCKGVLWIGPKTAASNAKASLSENFNGITFFSKDLISRFPKGTLLEDVLTKENPEYTSDSFDVVIIDELHTAKGEKTWHNIKTNQGFFKDKFIIGMTATATSNLRGVHFFNGWVPLNNIIEDSIASAQKKGVTIPVNVAQVIDRFESNFDRRIKRIGDLSFSNTLMKLKSQTELKYGSSEEARIQRVSEAIREYEDNNEVKVDKSKGFRVFAFFNRIAESKTHEEEVVSIMKKAYGNDMKVNYIMYNGTNTGEKENKELMDKFKHNPEPYTIDVIATVQKGAQSLHPKRVKTALAYGISQSSVKLTQQFGRIIALKEGADADIESCNFIYITGDHVDFSKSLSKNSIQRGRIKLDERKEALHQEAMSELNAESKMYNSYTEGNISHNMMDGINVKTYTEKRDLSVEALWDALEDKSDILRTIQRVIADIEENIDVITNDKYNSCIAKFMQERVRYAEKFSTNTREEGQAKSNLIQEYDNKYKDFKAAKNYIFNLDIDAKILSNIEKLRNVPGFENTEDEFNQEIEDLVSKYKLMMAIPADNESERRIVLAANNADASNEEIREIMNTSYLDFMCGRMTSITSKMVENNKRMAAYAVSKFMSAGLKEELSNGLDKLQIKILTHSCKEAYRLLKRLQDKKDKVEYSCINELLMIERIAMCAFDVSVVDTNCPYNKYLTRTNRYSVNSVMKGVSNFIRMVLNISAEEMGIENKSVWNLYKPVGERYTKTIMAAAVAEANSAIRYVPLCNLRDIFDLADNYDDMSESDKKLLEFVGFEPYEVYKENILEKTLYIKLLRNAISTNDIKKLKACDDIFNEASRPKLAVEIMRENSRTIKKMESDFRIENIGSSFALLLSEDTRKSAINIINTALKHKKVDVYSLILEAFEDGPDGEAAELVARAMNSEMVANQLTSTQICNIEALNKYSVSTSLVWRQVVSKIEAILEFIDLNESDKKTLDTLINSVIKNKANIDKLLPSRKTA